MKSIDSPRDEINLNFSFFIPLTIKFIILPIRNHKPNKTYYLLVLILYSLLIKGVLNKARADKFIEKSTVCIIE